MKRFLLSDLKDWKEKKNRKPLLLKGARQVGKTWLLEDFGKSSFEKIHIFNFQEEPELKSIFQSSLNPDKIIRSLELAYSIKINSSADLIFFDEIQECPEAITSLKFFYENKPEQAICCAGSHIGVSGLSTSFPVGKIDILDLYPMSFREFLYNYDIDLFTLIDNPENVPQILHNRLIEKLKEYYAVGGMPEAVDYHLRNPVLQEESFSHIRYIQKLIINGYQSDFAKHAGKSNANHINRVFENIPVQIMKADDYSVGRFRFKEVIPGYSKYSQLVGPIEWLIHAALCYPVHVLENPRIPLKAQRKENSFKIFFLDIGLLNAMNNLSLLNILNQDFGSYKGYLAENYVAQELMAQGQSSLYSWKGRTSEIEFLIEKSDGVLPLEVKSGVRAARTKSLDVYEQKYAPDRSIVLSMNPHSKKGIRHRIPLYSVGAAIS